VSGVREIAVGVVSLLSRDGLGRAEVVCVGVEGPRVLGECGGRTSRCVCIPALKPRCDVVPLSPSKAWELASSLPETAERTVWGAVIWRPDVSI
jgi:hypothetical protein